MPDAPATLTLAELGERFNRFADEARTYAGTLYSALSLANKDGHGRWLEWL